MSLHKALRRRREWLFDITEERNSGDKSEGSLGTTIPDIPRDREIHKLIRGSDDCIKLASNLITDNQILSYDKGLSDSASSPVILNDGILPKEPEIRDLAPGRLAFRKPGDTFCQEQHSWRSIIELKKHREIFGELRWAIRLGSWINGNPQENLTQLIETRLAGIKNIKAKVDKISNARHQLSQKLQEFASRIEGTESSKSELPDLEMVQLSLRIKRYEVEQATEEYQKGISNLTSLKERITLLVKFIERGGDGIEHTSDQAEQATDDEENANEGAEGHSGEANVMVDEPTEAEMEVQHDLVVEGMDPNTTDKIHGQEQAMAYTNKTNSCEEGEREDGKEEEEEEEEEEEDDDDDDDDEQEESSQQHLDQQEKPAASYIDMARELLEETEKELAEQEKKNTELETRKDEAWDEYQQVGKKSVWTKVEGKNLDRTLKTLRGEFGKVKEQLQILEDFEKEQKEDLQKLENEIAVVQAKQKALQLAVTQIAQEVQAEVVNQYPEPETSASTHSTGLSGTESGQRQQFINNRLKTKLAKHIDNEQAEALATLRAGIKQNTKLGLADKDIDELLKVHCAVFVAQPLTRLTNAREKIYRDLNDCEFRLLVLCSAPNKYHPLIARLQKNVFQKEASNIDNLNKKRDYAALSYSWGDGSADHHIYLLPEGTDRIEDSFSLPIRENLFCALHRLRRKDENVTLWVDAVCIDQENAAEKTSQLGCMPDIYSQARMVCIWLGESDNERRSDKAIDSIPQLVDMATLDANTDAKDHAQQWAALSELTRDPWFARRWIVQEISLASKAVVYCGEKMVHWDALVDAIALLVANEERVRALFDPTKWRYGRNTLGEIQFSSANVLLEVISSLFPTTEDRSKHKPLKSLEYLVTTLQTFDVSDPRDLIYALVHISRDHAEERITVGHQPTEKQRSPEEVQRIPPKLHIDYGTPIPTVFKQFTQYCVETSGSLDIICRPWAKQPKSQERSLLKTDNSLPSWVPLLENAEFGGPGQSHKGRKNGRSFVGTVGQQIYNASNGMQAKGVTFDEYPMRMKVSGLLLGTVEEVSPRCSGGVVFRESLRLGGWEGIDSGPKAVPARIWRTLIADRTSNGLSPPLWYQRACLRSLEIADMFSGGDLNTGQLSDEVVFARDYLRRVREVTWNRCFFRAAGHEDAHISEIHHATDDAKANAELQASNDGEDVPEIVMEEADQTKHEETIDAELSIKDAEKFVQDGDAVEQAEEIEPPVDISKGIDDPSVPAPNERNMEMLTATSSEQQGRNHTSEQDAGSGSERTEDWFGICPRNTSYNDKVCILFGCSVPVILRPVKKDAYKLIGEAYVHGAMSGEVVRTMEKEALERSTKIFDIR
ncbi:HET-domain-containing protein [Aspergillus eucalypticola CBS 122712]|uniref:HET-domain-containing protein n=1 Tax=Aspergillus eucalypticola (strain CBS 122712 / IBT 29274) TaxID=1448314 RepID=A0A317UTL3_ASPEC|nr:HET-domain-containing protein [Aspergillus eucalypticola CBS 122712]PWY63832.1 HET-domain-containing protein [Aspergillus eucalypticola CBS 122712]